MKLYLVRHGQTDWNNERRMQGHKNIPMNEVGIQQINDLADRIKKEDIRFDRLICSPLDRAKKSAEIIKDKTGYKNDIIIDEDFIERSNGLLEGEVWTPELDFDDPKYQIETIPELCKRAERAVGKYTFGEDENVMIVAHGAILAAVRTVLSEYRIGFFDKEAQIIQGNILVYDKEEGKEPTFYNCFDN